MVDTKMKKDSPRSIDLALLPRLLTVLGICLIGALVALLCGPKCTPLVFVFLLLAAGLLATVLLAVYRLDRVLLRLDTAIEQIWNQLDSSAPPPIRHRVALGHINTMADKLENILDDYLAATNKMYQDELLFRNMQFAALQSQINPHFLYNTLESIRGNALCAGVNEIVDIMESLSLYFRYSISRKGTFVTIMEEIESIQNYFHIQHYRFGDRFALTVDTEQAVGLDEYLIPKLTLQPLIENSIFHGLEPKLGQGTVRVSFVTGDSGITIRVSDNGIGMEQEQVKQIIHRLHEKIDFSAHRPGTGGIALYNVNQRIQLLFGREYGLAIKSEHGVGTDVEIRMPALSTPPEVPNIV